jgi:hypothetical protein
MALVEAGKALVEYRNAVQKATTAQLESYRKLAEVSGGMAAVMANRDVTDMIRNMRRGDALAPSAKALSEAEARRKDAAEPMKQILETFKNDLLTLLNNGLVPYMELTSEVAKELYKWLNDGKEWMPGDAKDTGLGAAIAGPGGVLEMAKKIEDDARDELAKIKAAKWKPAAPPGMLPLP